MSERLENRAVGEGRDPRSGRFLPGNAGGPGNPHAKKIAQLRSALMEAVEPEDVRLVVEALKAEARSGDTAAARELFDRLFGKATVDALIELRTQENVESYAAIIRNCMSESSPAMEAQDEGSSS